MRLLIGLAGAALLFSTAHAGTMSVGPNPDRPFSFNFGSGALVFGPVIFDSYRSLDGKNFYLDDSSPRSSDGKIFPGAFNFGLAESPVEPFSKPFAADLLNFTRSGAGGAFAGAPGSLGGPFSQGGSGGLSQAGMKSSFFSQAGLDSNRSGDHDGFQLLGGGSFDPGRSNVSATPLPPAWSMLLIGLGCFGMIISRRQRKKSALAGAWSAFSVPIESEPRL
jgi:hypothetical protein